MRGRDASIHRWRAGDGVGAEERRREESAWVGYLSYITELTRSHVLISNSHVGFFC